jgi:hypothetical protein
MPEAKAVGLCSFKSAMVTVNKLSLKGDFHLNFQLLVTCLQK